MRTHHCIISKLAKFETWKIVTRGLHKVVIDFKRLENAVGIHDDLIRQCWLFVSDSATKAGHSNMVRIWLMMVIFILVSREQHFWSHEQIRLCLLKDELITTIWDLHLHASWLGTKKEMCVNYHTFVSISIIVWHNNFRKLYAATLPYHFMLLFCPIRKLADLPSGLCTNWGTTATYRTFSTARGTIRCFPFSSILGHIIIDKNIR